MKLRFENIFEVILDDPARAQEAQSRANLISALRDIVTTCQWNQEEKISVTLDESTIVISRAGLEPKYTLADIHYLNIPAPHFRPKNPNPSPASPPKPTA